MDDLALLTSTSEFLLVVSAQQTPVTSSSRLLLTLTGHQTQNRVARYQTKGLLGARDFDKYVFRAGLAPFDDTDPNHLGLVEVAREAEQVASEVDISADVANSVARKLVLAALLEAGVSERLEKVARACLA